MEWRKSGWIIFIIKGNNVKNAHEKKKNKKRFKAPCEFKFYEKTEIIISRLMIKILKNNKYIIVIPHFSVISGIERNKDNDWLIKLMSKDFDNIRNILKNY